jgi:hypothetical protein
MVMGWKGAPWDGKGPFEAVLSNDLADHTKDTHEIVFFTPVQTFEQGSINMQKVLTDPFLVLACIELS